MQRIRHRSCWVDVLRLSILPGFLVASYMLWSMILSELIAG